MLRSLRRVGGILVNLAVVGLLVGVVVWAGPYGDPAGPGNGRGGPKADEGGAEEAAEQLEESEKRNAAFEKARRDGTSGQTRPAAAAAAPGWVGEFPMDTTWDDWEPAIAADPNGPWVYTLVTRYGAPKPCPGNCPTPWIALEISSDNGATWSAGKPLCACKGSGQFDPIIEVVPSTGHVYALYMNGFNVVFTKSTNHGQTWSAPVATWGNVSWNDKPVIAMSDDGRDVYVSFNGPTGGDPYAVQSHDFGATWTQRKLVDGSRYFFAFDADVAAGRNGLLRRVEHPLRRRRQQGHDAGRRDRSPRLHLARSRRHLGEPGRGIRPAGRSLRRGGLHARLLPRPPGPVRRRQREHRLPLRRSHDGGRPPDDLGPAVDKQGRDLERRPSPSRRPARTPPRRPSSPAAAATSGPTTTRPRAPTTTPGTSGIGAPPTAARRGPLR